MKLSEAEQAHIEAIEVLHHQWIRAMDMDDAAGVDVSEDSEDADGAFWDYVSRVVSIDFGDDFEGWCLKATQREIAAEAIKRIRSFYARTPGMITIVSHPSFLCTWDDLVQIHTPDSLHAEYDSSNLFEPEEWDNSLFALHNDEAIKLNDLMDMMEVGDHATASNCRIQRIK